MRNHGNVTKKLPKCAKKYFIGRNGFFSAWNDFSHNFVTSITTLPDLIIFSDSTLLPLFHQNIDITSSLVS